MDTIIGGICGMLVRTVHSADGSPIATVSLGTGEGLIVVGGALRRSEDYLPLARELAHAFTVHLIDRRGRGRSAAMSSDYSIERECDDLVAVAAATGATRVFGHSYGGLVALRTAARWDGFSSLVAYEPAVSVDGSIPSGWLRGYEDALAVGDSRGAFAALVRGAGGAPPALARMPAWYVRLVLRMAVRGEQWRTTEALLPAALLEHREVARLEGVADYGHVCAHVALLAGSRSPRPAAQGLRLLHQALPHARLEIVKGLDHLAPEKAPATLAARIVAALSTPSVPTRPATPRP